MKTKLKKDRDYRYKTHGIWNRQEEQSFLLFLKLKRDIFEDPTQRKSLRIFNKMGKFIQTRSAAQCRSHYQTCELKYGDLDTIIDGLGMYVEELGDQKVKRE